MAQGSRSESFWQRSIDLSPLWRVPLAHPFSTLTALGILLRLLVYFQDKQPWLDEVRLWGNLINVSPFDYDKPLDGDQLAPIGFLFIERLLAMGFGNWTLAMRAVPLVAGLAALTLFARTAQKLLPRRQALLALALFAFSDDMIYYSDELKPYSVDAAVAVVLMYVTAVFLDQKLRGWTAAGLTLGIALVPWFSFPSAFVVGGCGLTVLAACLVQRRHRDLALWIGIGCVWGVSLFVSYRLSTRLLSRATSMYVFWYFAFLPLYGPGASWKVAGSVLLELFVNPLDLVPWYMPLEWVAFPIAVILAGIAWFAHRRPLVLLMLLTPVLLAITAAALKMYPIHGRLSLMLVPISCLLLAAGTAWLDRPEIGITRWLHRALVAILIVTACLSGPYEATAPRSREFNAHGDLHKNRFVD